MDFNAILQAMQNGGSLGGSIAAGFAHQPPAAAPAQGQQFPNALAQPAVAPTASVMGVQNAAPAPDVTTAGMAAGQAGSLPQPAQQHGAFSNILKMFAGA